MKTITIISFLFALLVAGVHVQAQETFISELKAIQNSKLSDIKGEFVTEAANGDKYYICNKPLTGFTTFILQNKNLGPLVLNASPNKAEPLPPELESVINELNNISARGTIKKDSDTDTPLKNKLKTLPKIKRIIVFVEKDETRSIHFYVAHDDTYMIAITTKN